VIETVKIKYMQHDANINSQILTVFVTGESDDPAKGGCGFVPF
jgi:hypothetical protein